MATRTFHASFTAAGVAAVRVLAFREEHSLGRPSSAEVTVQLPEDADPEAFVGSSAALAFAPGDDAPEHLFLGVVEAITLIGSTAVAGSSLFHARFHVVSAMALLEGSVTCEIHQELDVKEIVSKVLEAHHVPAARQDWRLAATYPKRTYCVQYNETALAFVSRLLEAEGIYYFVEPGDDGEKIVFQDDSTTAAPIEGAEEIPFRHRTGLEVEEDAVYGLADRRRVVPGKVVLRDYDFERPKLDMTVEAEADEGADLEIYDFPGGYVEPSEGKRLAAVRLEAEQGERLTAVIEADCSRIAAGRKLTIEGAPIDDMNRGFLVTAVVHELGAASGGGQPVYLTTARLLPDDVKFRTPITTPVPVVAGPQSARVVAPAGAPPEEIHTDEHGRCKVKFHWDRADVNDDKASCWMRVTQLQTSGSMILPRVDWEVVVEFLEGDPDRPVVTGRLYNGFFMPPYALPEGKTRTSMQTASTPGGGGRNEIRLEDRAGSEEIMINAQHNETIATANNKKKTVGNCETRKVGADSTLTVGANQDVKVTKGDQNAIGADQSVSVGGNRTVEVNAVTGLTVGGAATTSVGGNHMEMDGNPLEGLLALAAQKAAEVLTAKAGQALDAIEGAVQARVNQVMGPVNALQQQADAIGQGMHSLANGDLSAAPGLLSAAAGLPGPGGFGGGQQASRSGGGEQTAQRSGGGDGGAGAPAGGGGDGGGGAQGAGAGGATQASPERQAIDHAVNGAIQRGVRSAAGALGEALGLGGGGGGGESEANVGGPEGSVAGIDAEDRAKGPGHATGKISGSHTETVGAVKVIAALNGVNTNVAGALTQSIGAARVELVMGNRAETAEGSKTENALGLVIVSRADESETVGGSKTTMVGGAILEKIKGGHSIKAGAPSTFIGAFHKIEAGTAITLKCGASEVVIDGSGITMKSPLVTITAAKVSLTKSVAQV